MKNSFAKTTILALCYVAGHICSAQNIANLQIIHNSADPSLDTVDIYLNGLVFDSNVVFRGVVGFYPVQSDTGNTVIIAHKHSDGNLADSIRSFYFDSFATNQSYILMLYGVADSGFEPNPDSLNTALNMIMISQIDSASPDTASFDFKFFQGTTDLPAVKIIQRINRQTVVPTTLYGDTTTSYFTLYHDIYELQLISADSTQNFGTYVADLSTLAGQVGLVFTSGFLDSIPNHNGRNLGLYMALPDGSLIPFVLESSAFQLIHNCADTAADSVDVYINGKIAYQSLAFRNSTPALILFAHAPYNVGLAHQHSTSVNDTFWHQLFVMEPDTFYMATMSGLINPVNYAPNPDGQNTSFNVWVKTPAEYTGSSDVNFDFFLINGATDAPALELTPEGGPPVITNAVYGDMSNYISFPPDFYTLDLHDTTGNIIGRYFANFPAFSGQSGVLLLSGFLNPAANNNGAGLGLYLVPITGGPFIPLYPITGVKNIAENSNMEVFPNPASNQIFIRLNEAINKNASLEIIDMNGQIVKYILNNAMLTEGQTLSADVSDVSDGFYILKLTTANSVSSYKLIIAR